MLLMADLLDEVKTRYLLHQGGALDATDEQVEYWIRQALDLLYTVVPPIKLASGLVLSDRTVMLPQMTRRVYYVAREASILFPHQWTQYPSHLHIKRGVAGDGDEVAIWYEDEVDTSAAAAFDNETFLGPNWGKEFILVQAGMQLQRRDSKRAPGRGGTKEAQSFRIDKEDRGEIYQMMKSKWDGFFQEMRDKLQTRLAFNDVPMRDSPLEGLENHAIVISPLDKPGRRVP